MTALGYSNIVNTFKLKVAEQGIPTEQQLRYSHQQLVAFLTEVGYDPISVRFGESWASAWGCVRGWLQWNANRTQWLTYEKAGGVRRVAELKARISEMQKEINEVEKWMREN